MLDLSFSNRQMDGVCARTTFVLSSEHGSYEKTTTFDQLAPLPFWESYFSREFEVKKQKYIT